MKNLKLEIETLQISIYSDIISLVLKNHDIISVNKIITFAYLVKKEKELLKNVYSGNNTQDVVYKSLSLLTGNFDDYCNTIEFIIKAIHLLTQKGFVLIENNLISKTPDITYKNAMYEESVFMKKAIEASKQMTDRQFMKDVIHYV